jgi:putative hydrolase of the HAD superfamily
MPMPRALILDYGEVLTFPQRSDAMARMAGVAGAPMESFVAAYWRHRRAYDMGLTGGEYWTLVGEDLKAAGARPPLDVDALVALDVWSWTAYREETWALAARLRAAGVRTAVLSNGIREVIAHLDRERPLEAHFDVVVVSYVVGCAKPEPEIFQITLDRLGVAPQEALFVDDRQENIDAAKRLGIDTLHFTGAGAFERLRARVEQVP